MQRCGNETPHVTADILSLLVTLGHPSPHEQYPERPKSADFAGGAQGALRHQMDHQPPVSHRSHASLFTDPLSGNFRRATIRRIGTFVLIPMVRVSGPF